MPINAKITNLMLQIGAGTDADDEELDRLTHQLLMEMKELEVESVEFVHHIQAPKGLKSAADAITLGALAVAVLPSFLPKLVEFLQTWTMRGENRAIEIKTQFGDHAIDIKYSPQEMSPAELKRVIETVAHAIGTN